MKTTILLLLLFPVMCIAQTEPPAKGVVADTLSLQLKPAELEILQTYTQQWSQVQQAMNEFKAQLQQIESSYQNVLRMKIEAIGGDSKKWFTIKDGKIIYLK